MQDRKLVLLSFQFSWQIFEDSKTQILFSLNKTTHFSGHSLERWVYSLFKFTYFSRDAYCAREKMVFIDSSTFIANI